MEYYLKKEIIIILNFQDFDHCFSQLSFRGRSDLFCK